MLILTQTKNLAQTLSIILEKKSKWANKHSLFALLFFLWVLRNVTLITSITEQPEVLSHRPVD